MTKDKYDLAIDYLTEHPDEIYDSWNDGIVTYNNPHPVSSCLFGSTGALYACGCLTQVKSGRFPANNDELTRAIRADERIPEDAHYITINNLPVFAEWQRRLDKELGRIV